MNSNSSEYFDTQSGAWTDRYAVAGHFRNRLETALAWLPTGAGEALDYGCGSGVLACAMLERDYNVTAVDLSAGMLESATAAMGRTVGGQSSRFRVERVDGTARGGEWLTRSYQAVYSLGVLEYVEPAERLLEELASVVASDGVLVLSLPNRRSWLRRIETGIYRQRRWLRHFGIAAHLTDDDSYLKFQHHQFDKRWLDERLERLGLIPDAHEFAVAPSVMGRLAGSERIGMTLLARYVRED